MDLRLFSEIVKDFSAPWTEEDRVRGIRPNRRNGLA
jgi:hypothetical protein